MKSYLKPSLSTLLVGFFSLILLFLGLFAEVFVSSTPEVDLAQIYANPVPVAELQHLKTLKLTNKQGTFLFENSNPNGDLSGPWQMLEPQSLQVKGNVISKIIDALNVIRVRNFHPLEPINITSFSLDNPTLTMLFTTTQDKSYEIKMGLINPIDHSAYLSLSSQNQIYQIDPIEMALESYDLAQLVESKILALNPEGLASIEVYSSETLTLKLLKKDGQWLDQAGVLLSDTKVEKFFERLSNLKSLTILDKLNNDQKAYLIAALATPQYSLKVITGQSVRTYVIGEVKGPGPADLKLPAGSNYALSSDEKASFVLVDKEQLRVLDTKAKELK
jgi:hypothetical protein